MKVTLVQDWALCVNLCTKMLFPAHQGGAQRLAKGTAGLNRQTAPGEGGRGFVLGTNALWLL